MKHVKKMLGLPAYVVYLIGGVALLPLALRLVGYFRFLVGAGPSEAEKEDAKKAEVASFSNGSGVSPNVLLADAKALSHALGTTYSWFDPRSWSENEVQAMAVIQKYDPASFVYLERAYYVDVSSSLRGDLQKFLSPSQLGSLAPHIGNV